MPSILIVEKNATIKSSNLKVFSEDELYKKAGFKTGDGFTRQTVWSIDGNYTVELYGKTAGRAGQENKYDFPPPVDSTLFFGVCLLILRKNDEVVDLSTQEWEDIYEQLFGGFEDVGSGDSSDDDDDVLSTGSLTKSGYEKDGFIVDDDASNSEVDISSDEDAGRKATAGKKKKAGKTSNSDEQRSLEFPRIPSTSSPEYLAISESMRHHPDVKKTNARKKPHAVIYPEVSAVDENVKMVFDQVVVDETYLGCTTELCEEEYV